MNERENRCLSNGCLEFWIIDEEIRQIKVTTTDRITRTYRDGDVIPLPMFDSQITVDEILRFD